MDYRAHRLFHSLVVVGSALGCGAQATDDAAAPRGNRGTGASAAASPSEGATANPPESSATTPATSMYAVPSVIPSTSPNSCADPSAFTCDDYVARTGCRCEVENPSGQGECPELWQYTCDAYLSDPTSDGLLAPTEGVGCRCNLDALGPDDCAERYQFTCRSYAPETTDCYCDLEALSLELRPRCCFGEDWGCYECRRIK